MEHKDDLIFYSGVLEEVCTDFQCHLLSIFAIYQVVFNYFFIFQLLGERNQTLELLMEEILLPLVFLNSHGSTLCPTFGLLINSVCSVDCQKNLEECINAFEWWFFSSNQQATQDKFWAVITFKHC